MKCSTQHEVTFSEQGNMAPFWPYLVFGQYVHVGHGATFGLGKYRLAV
jgi:CRISPR/Cas system endoribonuclease Cas6 (RAMP superfamily)